MNPLQNRVTLFGEIVATKARGTLMGNRGCLHDGAQKIVREFQRKAWISCQLSFKGVKRTVMSPGEYTELFFLDEATALAAGHRPCAYCSRKRYAAFIAAWQAGNAGLLPSGKWSATHLDDCLQQERLDESGHKRLFQASADTLPDGTYIVMPRSVDRRAALLLGDQLLPWSAEGYLRPETRPRGFSVSVVTPRSSVRALTAGYKPARL